MILYQSIPEQLQVFFGNQIISVKHFCASKSIVYVLPSSDSITFLCGEKIEGISGFSEYEKLDSIPKDSEHKICVACVRFYHRLNALSVKLHVADPNQGLGTAFEQELSGIQRQIYSSDYLDKLITYDGTWFYIHSMSGEQGVTLCGKDLKVDHLMEHNVVPFPTAEELAQYPEMNNICHHCENVQRHPDEKSFDLLASSDYGGQCIEHIDRLNKTAYPRLNCVKCDESISCIEVYFLNDDSLCVVRPDEIVTKRRQIWIHFSRNNKIIHFRTKNQSGFTRREFLSCIRDGYLKIEDELPMCHYLESVLEMPKLPGHFYLSVGS